MKHNYIIKQQITEKNAKDIVGKNISLGELKCLLMLQTITNQIAVEWDINQDHKANSPRIDFIFTYKGHKFMLEFNGYQHFGLCDLNNHDPKKLLDYQVKFKRKQEWGIKHNLLRINYNVLMNNRQHSLEFINSLTATQLKSYCDLLITGSIGSVYNCNSI